VNADVNGAVSGKVKVTRVNRSVPVLLTFVTPTSPIWISHLHLRTFLEAHLERNRSSPRLLSRTNLNSTRSGPHGVRTHGHHPFCRPPARRSGILF